MNIETVNELIASLESAGEPSIREQKFLKLAKEFRICSASLDAAIKTGNVLADQNAQLAAENVALKNAFGPGDSVLNFLTIALRHTTYDRIDLDDVTLAFKMSLPETPATDRIVAGIKADGVEEFVRRLQQCVDEGDFVGDEVAVIVGAIDCGKEFCEQLREGGRQMIHFHGGPITPDTCALKAWKGRHAFISFANAGQLALASEVTQSFALDNGAFSFWTKKRVVDWNEYYRFVERWANHPRFSFAIIPDVIGGSSEENDALIAEWPHGKFIGAPVWHMNEPDERFIQLCNEFPRVAIGSMGEYDAKRPRRCVARLRDLIRHVVDENGYPICKLHGLRMLNADIFRHIPLSSADSTNVARNIGIDKSWQKSAYAPASKETRAAVLVERIESMNSASALNYNAERDRFMPQLAFEI